MTEQFLDRVRKDYFEAGGSALYDWDSFLKGYLASLKRFGGSNASTKEKA